MGRGVDRERCSAARTHGRPAMVNGLVSRIASSKREALDPEAAEKARTTGFIHKCLACVRVRAKGDDFEHHL